MKKMKRFAEGDAVGLDVMDESGELSKLRRNPETGELYSPTGDVTPPPSAKRAPAPAKTSAKTAAPAKPPVTKKEPKPMEAQESSAPPGYYRSFSGKMMPKTATERPDLGAMIGSGVSKVGKALGSLYEKPEKYMTKEEKESKMRAGSSSYKTGGSVSKASSRADGIAQRGKTRGKMC
jgi:hypothetical protein